MLVKFFLFIQREKRWHRVLVDAVLVIDGE